MDQLIFKFPFSKKYFEQDFYVSSNNFSAFKLVESWPTWPGKWLNIFGASGSGKTIDKIKLIEAEKINNEIIHDLNNVDCLIIDNFSDNIDEKLLYTILNQSKQLENYILINTITPLKKIKINLDDLKSRINSFVYIGIELPTDDLLKVIIAKTLSEKQISVNPKITDFIINNVERSYEKMIKFLKDIDELSLSSGKPININLIKKVLDK